MTINNLPLGALESRTEMLKKISMEGYVAPKPPISGSTFHGQGKEVFLKKFIEQI